MKISPLGGWIGLKLDKQASSFGLKVNISKQHYFASVKNLGAIIVDLDLMK